METIQRKIAYIFCSYNSEDIFRALSSMSHEAANDNPPETKISDALAHLAWESQREDVIEIQRRFLKDFSSLNNHEAELNRNFDKIKSLTKNLCLLNLDISQYFEHVHPVFGLTPNMRFDFYPFGKIESHFNEALTALASRTAEVDLFIKLRDKIEKSLSEQLWIYDCHTIGNVRCAEDCDTYFKKHINNYQIKSGCAHFLLALKKDYSAAKQFVEDIKKTVAEIQSTVKESDSLYNQCLKYECEMKAKLSDFQFGIFDRDISIELSSKLVSVTAAAQIE